jgi:hypothetical protein
MRTTSRIRTSAIAVALAAASLVAFGATTPASARPEPAPAAADVHFDPRHCPLTRLGTQFVRCDDLTGAGVSAPSWVPEHQ